MDPEPEVIREDIEETRSNLTEKIEILEKEVIGGVKDAREAVADTVETVKDKVETTVENVKDTIQDTIQSVKDTFDLRRQMDAHPWVFVGAAAGAGFLLGALVPPPRRLAHAGSYSGPGTFRESLSSLAGGPQGEPRHADHGPSVFTTLWQQFQPEVQQLKGLAIGAGIGLLRDMLKDSIPPSLSPQIENVLSNITTKLGGEEIRGPILPEDGSHESSFDRGRYAGASR